MLGGSGCSICASERTDIRPDRHGPTRLRSHLNSHESHMEGFRVGGFVGADKLEIEIAPHEVTMEGEIACLGNIVVNVLKTLEVLEGEGPDATVQTVAYAYNVSIRNRFNIFRYDNLHLTKGHPDPHHKDVYDWRTGEQLPESPKWVGAEHWPTLADVIREAQRWHGDHYAELDNPDDYPELMPRG